MLMPFMGVDASASHGSLFLVEPRLMYDACNYTLQVGDSIDYSYSATDTVVFEITRVPKIPRNPIPAPGIETARQEGTSGHGTLTADSDGIYNFWFYNPDNTTRSPVVVSYNVHPHESWLAEWGFALGLISAVAIVLVGAGIVVIVKTKRKGV
jgi:hypothetical protein